MKTKTHRTDDFDMMRGIASSFDPQPEPIPVKDNRLTKDVKRGREDPLLDHLKGMRDTTEPDRGHRTLKRSAR